MALRRVVTGHDEAGNPIVVSDGPPPHSFLADDGPGVADIWSLAGPVEEAADGFEPEGGFPIEPPVGGMWWRWIRLPLPDQSLPREDQFLDPHVGSGDGPRGMHATDTLDVALILDGQIELETETDSTVLGPGDCVVQRGTQHRWRVVGEGPCTYLVGLLSPEPGAPLPDPLPVRTDADEAGVRRVIVSVGDDGRSTISSDVRLAASVPFASTRGMTDLWNTNGRLASPEQGGDLPGPWQLEPPDRGVVWRDLVLPPGRDAASTLIHTTNTIDLLVLLEGTVELLLPGNEPVTLTPGDYVVQRATAHGWTNVGDGPARMVVIMIGAPSGNQV